MTAPKRGRPAEIPDATILAVRAALARGESVSAVSRAHRLARRTVRDIRAGTRRANVVYVPPAIEALATLPADLAHEAAAVREAWGIVAMLDAGGG